MSAVRSIPKAVTLATTVLLWPSPAHAAGWYLMGPPVAQAQVGAPLSAWRTVHSYDTARECERGRRDMAKVKKAPAQADAQKAAATDDSLGVTNLRCIASDDPRLK